MEALHWNICRCFLRKFRETLIERHCWPYKYQCWHFWRPWIFYTHSLVVLLSVETISSKYIHEQCTRPINDLNWFTCTVNLQLNFQWRHSGASSWWHKSIWWCRSKWRYRRLRYSIHAYRSWYKFDRRLTAYTATVL